MEVWVLCSLGLLSTLCTYTPYFGLSIDCLTYDPPRLYGIVIFQVYRYSQNYPSHEHFLLKAVVSTVPWLQNTFNCIQRSDPSDWHPIVCLSILPHSLSLPEPDPNSSSFLDTLQVVLTAHCLYHFLISNYGKPDVLQFSIWYVYITDSTTRNDMSWSRIQEPECMYLKIHCTGRIGVVTNNLSWKVEVGVTVRIMWLLLSASLFWPILPLRRVRRFWSHFSCEGVFGLSGYT